MTTTTYGRTWRNVAAGLAAVAALLAGALDALVTAAVGIPPIAWTVRQVAGAIRQAYQAGRYGPPSTCTDLAVYVVDAEIVDEGDR